MVSPVTFGPDPRSGLPRARRGLELEVRKQLASLGKFLMTLALALLLGDPTASWAAPPPAGSPTVNQPAEPPAMLDSYEFAVLVDLSGSFEKYLPATRRQLIAWTESLRPGDTVVLAVFSNESCNTLLKKVIEGPADQAALESIIQGFQVSEAGGTEPVQALNRTLSEMVRVQNDKAARRMFLFFSDGFPDAPEGGLRELPALDWNRIPADTELFLLSYLNTRDTELVRTMTQNNLRFSILSPESTEEFAGSLVAEMKARPPVPSARPARTLAKSQGPAAPGGWSTVALLLGLGSAGILALMLLARRRGRAIGGRIALPGNGTRARPVLDQLRMFEEDGAGGRRRVAGPFAMAPGLQLRVANQGGNITLPGDDLIRAELQVTRNGVVLRPRAGSTHPVRVDGKRVRETSVTLRNGSQIQFSPRWRLRVEIGRPGLEEVAG